MAPGQFSSRDESSDVERRNRIRRVDESSADGESVMHPLLSLQQQVGNAQVARLLAQRQSTIIRRDTAPEEEEDELQMKRAADVQRDTAPEEEEDEVQLKRAADVQRDTAPEEEEEELQLKRDTPEVGLEGGSITAELAGRIQARRGSGSSLDEHRRPEMENLLGTSFKDVRVHTDHESGTLNRRLGAKAFTTGNDIFFGDGAHPGDKHLLAHELTHVVQQRSMTGGGPMHVGPADDAFEREADNVAAALSSGTPGNPQRQVEEQGEE